MSRFRMTKLTLLGACLLATGNTVHAQTASSAWHFDETSGSTAFDAVGSVNGSLTGNASFTAGGISGNAMNSGTTGFADMGNNFAFGGNSTFSLVAWVKMTSADANGYIPAGRHQATVNAGYFLGVNNTGSASGEVTGGGIFYQAFPNAVSVNLGVNDGNWHQLVGVHDFAANQTKLYIDGVLRDTRTFTAFTASNANFAVAGILNSAGNQMFHDYTGLVDEVSIWNSPLSASAVTYLFNNPGATAIPEPATWLLIGGASLAGIRFLRRKRCKRVRANAYRTKRHTMPAQGAFVS